METAKGKTREETINRLADRIDHFEKYTQPHSRLIAELATNLARRFGLLPADIEAITEAAMLHDIGLYAMAPAYHAQPRPLSFESRLDLWRHSVIGEQQMAKRDSMRSAQLLVRWHHEWWNGSGYPDMLAFEDIPIGARILRAVELSAAVLGDRPYRSAQNEQQTIETLTASAGIECDPYVVKALLSLLDELLSEIHRSEAALASNAESAPVTSGERVSGAIESTVVPTADISINQWTAESISTEPGTTSSSPAPRAWGEGLRAFVVTNPEPGDAYGAEPQTDGNQARTISMQTALPQKSTPDISLAESLLAHARTSAQSSNNLPHWRGWRGTLYNRKQLLGFQASVLRQLEFRSIALPFWSEARLDWYLKTWGKVIFANDPRVWAGIVAHANVEATEPLSEETITRILDEVYVPRVRLSNPGLRRWFNETDAWWMDNLRRNIESLDDQLVRAQATTLGLQTGDYALSFDNETLELRRPLTTVFWRLAGRAFVGPAGHPHNRSFNQPAEDFIRHARADLCYLRCPSSYIGRGGAEARSEWREAWVHGADSEEGAKAATAPQSRQSYLNTLERLLKPAANFKIWAVEYQEPDIASAQDIIELIKEYRPVKATYSKDVTEVAGGLRSSIIVAEKSSPR